MLKSAYLMIKQRFFNGHWHVKTHSDIWTGPHLKLVGQKQSLYIYQSLICHIWIQSYPEWYTGTGGNLTITISQLD